jgi:putative membrane protein
MMDGYGNHMENGWGGGWIIMLLMMLVFAVLIGVVIWFLLSGSRRPTGGSPAQRTRSTPEQILGDRLARGEIDPDEYRIRLAALKEHNATT